MKKSQSNFWLDNDLISVPFIGGVFLLAALIIAAYVLAAPLGVAVTVGGASLVLLLLASMLEVDDRGYQNSGSTHLLLVANQALADTELREAVLLRTQNNHGLALVAPVRAQSLLAALASDLDEELQATKQRVEDFHHFLESHNIGLEQQINLESNSLQSALDGTREFPIREVLAAPRSDEHWASQEEIAAHLDGIPVDVLKVA